MRSKYMLVIAILLISAIFVNAQAPLTATTPDGKKVILSSDGTWKFAPETREQSQAKVKSYNRSDEAREVLDLNNGAIKFFYDSNEWMKKAQKDPNRTEFTHKSGDVYAMIIAERLEMTPAALVDFALSNARKAATTLNVLNKEEVVVNGNKVVHLLFEAEVNGIEFIFEGYYYAGPEGTIQVIAYSGKALHKEYKEVIGSFLNGFKISSKEKSNT